MKRQDMEAHVDRDKDRGLYEKYIVKRSDGSSEAGGKHENCMYYVLDLEHDRHARAALEAYAKSCEVEYPLLSQDLKNLVTPPPDCGCREAMCQHVTLNRVNAPRFGA